jgi:pimeloyl-ACP methyl ester carboxylesterase
MRELLQRDRPQPAPVPAPVTPAPAPAPARQVSPVAHAKPIYLHDGGERIFAFLHPAAGGERQNTSVLICPPLGWEDVSSYRSRRAWAEQLAHDGFPALRIDLPSTGDSAGGARDPERLAAWSSAIAAAAQELRAEPGCERVVAIGIGLGGLLICQALCDGAAIDEAVLWAASARGRTQLRELRAFSRLQDFAAPDDAQAPHDGELTAGGFLLSGETVASLEQLDVGELQLPARQLRRALLLGRDGVPADARLKAALEQHRVELSEAPGDGYATMMAKPQFARSPTETFALVRSWLAQESSPVLGLRVAPAAAADDDARESDVAVELSLDGVPIRERPLAFERSRGKLFGILSEPLRARQDLCMVMLNAGAIRRIGPNRMWVEASRRAAAQGVPTVRLDLEGIGDADGDEERFADEARFHVPGLVAQVRLALDTLEAEGYGRRFVLAGLCSGAYWSFHAALQDERVSAAVMLNPRAIYWDAALDASRDLRRGLLRPSSWRKVLRGEVSLARIVTLAVKLPFSLPLRALRRWQQRHAGGDDVERAFDQIGDAGQQLTLIFSENEPLYEEFEKEGRLERLQRRTNVELEQIPGRDHTLRPAESQRRAHVALDRAIARELDRSHQSRESSKPPAAAPVPWRKRDRERRLVA